MVKESNTMSSTTGITGFIEIFEGRLVKMKHHLKQELIKSKHERDRQLIRRILADARKLNKTLNEMRKASTVNQDNQHNWVSLTEEEIGELYRAGWSNNMDFARAIEAKLKEKNGKI